MSGFRRGTEAAEKAAQFTSFARTNFLKIEKDGDKAVVRFITEANSDDQGRDGWITVDMHQNVPTKPKPSDWKSEKPWPAAMMGVCRHDQAFRDEFGDCYICDVLMKQPGSKLKKPTGRVWALACLREEVRGDGSPELGGAESKGKLLGYRDAIRKVSRKKEDSDETEEFEEKAIVVCNYGHKNFFSPLAGFANHYGTALDRDYLIVRKGTGTATDYNLIPLDPVQTKVKNEDGTEEMVPFDVRDPRVLARYGFNSIEEKDTALETAVRASADDDHYARWFNPDASPTNATDGGDGSNVHVEDDEPGEEELAALRARVQGYGTDGAPAEATTEEKPKEAVAASAPAGAMNFD